MNWILFSIGMIMLFMGGYVTIWAKDSKKMFEELSKLSEKDMRSFGLLVSGIGLTIVILAWFIIKLGVTL